MAAAKVTVRPGVRPARSRVAEEVPGADVTRVLRSWGDADDRGEVVVPAGGRGQDVGIRHDLVVALVRRAHRRRRRPLLRVPHW